MGVFVRDIAQFIQPVLMALMFTSAVFFPLSALPDWLRPVMAFTPLAVAVEMVRNALVFGTLPDASKVANSIAAGAIIAVLGYLFFKKQNAEVEQAFDYAVQLQNVIKRFAMFKRPEDRLKQMIVPHLRKAVLLQPKPYFKEFTAVSNVSLNIKRGETIGIIGRNGSGKSTLRQMIVGTLQPTSGTVKVKGRIAALLELGAGFNPEFTGRENVYVYGAILGFSRSEMQERLEAIAAFAAIGEFIEHPVRAYSSGMFVRLAFAVATAVEPDILIVEEALSVGD